MPREVDATSDLPPEGERRPGSGEPQSGSSNDRHGQPHGAGVVEHRFVAGAIVAERYRVVSRVGHGAMGEVYCAEDLRLRQRVALKFLPPRLRDDAGSLDRLHAEVRLAREVAHPNVVRIYDIGSDRGEHFITMEFVDGSDLHELLRRVGSLNPDKAIEIARQICAGVAAIHDRGLLHRDLKPSNILLDSKGRVRITDFGLSVRDERRAGGDGRRSPAGTPAYMAPEQWTGAPVSVASDVYAIGLILFELLSGRSAAVGSSIDELRSWHLSPQSKSLSGSLSSFDPMVERLILQCLESEPARRPRSARAIAAGLPGGNAIAAALAAGETPSPEVIAAAGASDRLSVRSAIAIGAALLIVLVAWLALPSPDRPLDFLPAIKPPAVLSDRAAAILEAIGSTSGDAWTGRGFTVDASAIPIAGTALEPELIERVRSGEIEIIGFFERRSPVPLLPTNDRLWLTPDDPPLSRPGMELVRLTVDGRLRSLLRVPATSADPAPLPGASADPAPTIEVPRGDERSESIDRLIRESGLDPALAQAETPRRRPTVDVDEIRAWRIPHPPSSREWSIHAGLIGEDVVWFEASAARPEPDADSTDPRQATGATPNPGRDAEDRWSVSIAMAPAAILALTVGVILLALANWRRGRGDVRGATTLALAVVIADAASIWMSAEVSKAPIAAFELLRRGFQSGVTSGALIWTLYMSIEPFVRRAMPRQLISWQRMVRGRVTDPKVGRDLAVGTLTGVAVLLISSLLMAIELRTGAVPRIGRSGTTPQLLDALKGGPDLLSGAILGIADALSVPLALLVAIAIVSLFVRRTIVAAAIVWLALSLLAAVPNTGAPIIIVGAIIEVGALILLLVWYGPVATVGAVFAQYLLMLLPVTSRVDAWNFQSGLVGVAGVIALGSLGLVSGVAGRAYAPSRA